MLRAAGRSLEAVVGKRVEGGERLAPVGREEERAQRIGGGFAMKSAVRSCRLSLLMFLTMRYLTSGCERSTTSVEPPRKS